LSHILRKRIQDSKKKNIGKYTGWPEGTRFETHIPRNII
jgi:hypothetical protein